MKKQIVDGVEKFKTDGAAKARQVQDTVHEAVSSAAHQAVSLRDVVKEATSTAVEELEKREVATEGHIKAAVQGAIDGVVTAEQTAIEKTQLEIWLLKARLREEEAELATKLREALQGARESTASFVGDAKKNVEAAVSDARKKYADVLGQTEETVKQTVRGILVKGENIEEMVALATKDATERALAQAHFSAEKVKKVAHTVISAAVESAEEAGANIAAVAKGAVQGTGDGISAAVESTRETLSSASEKSRAFLEADLAQTKEDVEAVEELFLDVVRKVGDHSQDVAKEVASQTKETAASLKAKAEDVSSWISRLLDRT
jgi:hypothetical protein